MRFPLFLFIVFLSSRVYAQSPEITYSVDSTGKTNVCIKGSFEGSINIQQYRWNKWVKMDGFRMEKEVSDTCFGRWIPLHSGENTIRLQVIPMDTAEGMHCLAEIKLWNGAPLNQNAVGGHLGSGDTLQFPRFTAWEIYDQNGVMVKKGQSDSVPLQGFEQGGYFLLYDNIVTEFLICNHKDE